MSELYDPKHFINFENGMPVSYLGLENNVVDNNYQTEQDPPGPIGGRRMAALLARSGLSRSMSEYVPEEGEQKWYIHQLGDVNKCDQLENPPTVPKDKKLTAKKEGKEEDCTIYTGDEKQACTKRNQDATNQASHEIPENPGKVERPKTAFG